MGNWKKKLPWNLLSFLLVRRLKFSSLFKISTLGVMTLFVILNVASMLVSFTVSIKSESVTTTNRISDSLSEKLISPLLVGDYKVAQRIIDTSVSDKNIYDVRLVVHGSFGDIVITPQVELQPSNMTAVLLRHFPDAISAIAMPVVEVDVLPSMYQENDFEGVDVYNLGKLYITLDFSDTFLSHSVMLFLAMVMLGLSILFIFSLSRTINATVSLPLSRLLDATRAMSANNFTRQIAVNPSKQPEIAELIDHFNGYSKVIVERNAELSDLIGSMDKVISQRTHDLEMALAKANQSAESKSNFINIMSHELNQPLFSARMGLNNLARQPEALASQSIQHYVSIINQHLDNARSQIEHVLEFTRNGRGAYVPKEESFDLYRMVESLVASHSTSASLKGLYIDLILEGHTPNQIISCPDGWRHILNNLIGNAIKYTKTGGVVIRLSTTDFKTPSRFSMVAEISDTGIGIHQEQLDRIFEFYTQIGDATKRTEGGYGIGLGIVASYVEALRGEKSVHSSPAGSTFKVIIPVERSSKSLGLVQTACVGMIESLDPCFVLFDDRDSWREGLLSRIQNVSAQCYSTDSLERAASIIDGSSLKHRVVCIGRTSNPAFMSSLAMLHEKAVLIVGMQIIYPGSNDLKEAEGLDIVVEEYIDITDLMRQVSMAIGDEVGQNEALVSPQVMLPLNGKSILLVDDNPHNLDLTQEYLSYYGAKVDIALGPEMGIKMAKARKYDALCIDIMMPLINGIEVASQIRQDSLNQDSALFAFTAGYLDDEKMDELKKLDMSMILKMDAREKMIKSIAEALS